MFKQLQKCLLQKLNTKTKHDGKCLDYETQSQILMAGQTKRAESLEFDMGHSGRQ